MGAHSSHQPLHPPARPCGRASPWQMGTGMAWAPHPPSVSTCNTWQPRCHLPSISCPSAELWGRGLVPEEVGVHPPAGALPWSGCPLGTDAPCPALSGYRGAAVLHGAGMPAGSLCFGEGPEPLEWGRQSRGALGADGDGEGDRHSKGAGHGQPRKGADCCQKWCRTLGHRAERGRAVSWGPWDWHQPSPAPPAPCQNLPDPGAHPPLPRQRLSGSFYQPSPHCQGLARC